MKYGFGQKNATAKTVLDQSFDADDVSAQNDQAKAARCSFRSWTALRFRSGLGPSRRLHCVHSLLPEVGLAQLFQASLSGRSLRGQVLGVACGLVARDVVEVRAHSRVESIAQIFEETRTGRAKVLLEIRHALWTILDGLANDLAQVCRDLVHVLRLRSSEVIELVGVHRRSIHEALRSSLTDIIGANKGIAGVAQRVAEPTFAIDILDVRLQQVVHEKVVPEHGQWHSSIDQTLLTPPVVL